MSKNLIYYLSLSLLNQRISQRFCWQDIPPPADTLRVTNCVYAIPFLKMVKALVLSRIAFEAYNLENVLDNLSGESYFCCERV